jgi:hypothetical protein
MSKFLVLRDQTLETLNLDLFLDAYTIPFCWPQSYIGYELLSFCDKVTESSIDKSSYSLSNNRSRSIVYLHDLSFCE